MPNTVTIPPTIKAAIFDVDGTMIINMAYHKKAWQEYLQSHGINLSEEEFRQKISGKKNDQIFELVFGRKLTPEEVQEYSEEKEALYRQLYEQDIQEVAGLTQLIRRLHEHTIHTAIATTAPAKNREFALKALRLEGKFDVILGDEHVKQGKPDPEIYLSAARELSLKPEECIVFEDSPPGVASGKNAGMLVVGVLTSHSIDELSDADYYINDFTEMDI